MRIANFRYSLQRFCGLINSTLLSMGKKSALKLILKILLQSKVNAKSKITPLKRLEVLLIIQKIYFLSFLSCVLSKFVIYIYTKT